MIFSLTDFIRESNRIEGIHRDPLESEIVAHEELLELHQVQISDIEHFVSTIQPRARLRINPGDNVMVGSYMPPPGDISIKTRLEDILRDMYASMLSCNHRHAHKLHHQYECLHPFTDGNGRSGRALWLWCHNSYAPLGFLHQWYYDTLKYGRL